MCVLGRAWHLFCARFFKAKIELFVGRCLNGSVTRIFRYVDDYLVLVENDEAVNKVLGVFKTEGTGLSVASKVPKPHSLQFLDLSLRFKSSHVCFFLWTAFRQSIRYF